MSHPPEEDDDQIFSGKALTEDGAVKPAPGSPHRNEVAGQPTRGPSPARPNRPPAPPARPPSPAPPMPGASLLDDPAWEPAFSAIPPRVRDGTQRSSGLELAERPPPPMASDYVPPRPERPPRFETPDIHWGKWIFRLVLVGALGAGVWVVVTGKVSLGKYSLDLLRTVTPPASKPEPESTPGGQTEGTTRRRVPTPAPTLLVLSEPSGAKVLIAGSEVGVTPWAGDNVWPAQPIKIEVRMPGYKPWVGTTMGGKQATLEATLKRR